MKLGLLSLLAWASLCTYVDRSPQSDVVNDQRLAVAKIRVEAESGIQTGAAIYVGNDQQYGYFVTAYHTIDPDRVGSIKSVKLQLYNSPRFFEGELIDKFDPSLDLGVIRADFKYLPSQMKQLFTSEPVPATAIRIIGHPASGDWSVWSGRVENEHAPAGDFHHFIINKDNSLTPGYSGGGIFDVEGNFLGMHLETTASYGKELKSREIQNLLEAFRVPTNNFGQRLSVTVRTNPSGRAFTVDDMNYSAPMTFSWRPGSSHKISTTSSQAGTTTDTQYVWNGWSDGGPISHSVIATVSTTYTADFTSQFMLTMNAGIGGTVNPVSGFFNNGQIVNISATPSANFHFSGWVGSGSGSFTGSTNRVTVTMNGPIIEAGSFAPASNTVEFSDSSYIADEGAGFVNITINRPDGGAEPSFVRYATGDGTAKEGKNYISAYGVVTFAPGETTQTFPVLIIDNSLVEGSRTVNLTLTNSRGSTLGARNSAVITINENDSTAAANPLDTPHSFVQYQYYDFMGTYPDASGWDFWTKQITECASDQRCIEVQHINVSAAFLLSIEFHSIGYFIERFYKVAYGNATGASKLGVAHTLQVPIIRFDEFLRDNRDIRRGVSVGASDWERILEHNKQVYALGFVQRSRFLTAFPTALTPAQFVDQLNQGAGNVLSASERTTAINLFGGAGDTTNSTARAQAMRQVAEDQDLAKAEFNRWFVLSEYYGYLHRNPNDAPESTLDYTGFDVWLTKLNQFNGDYIKAEMLKPFVSSTEYRQRFGPSVGGVPR
jgi:hypothetical protein